MPSFKRPGVYAEEILLNPQSTTSGSTATVYGAFVGTNGRGPIVPTFISTWSEYVANFGPWSGPYLLPHALFQFFANGGAGCYVTRVAGVGAATATRTLRDVNSVNTLAVSAVNPGAWGTNIFLDVAAYGVAGGNRFSITVHYGDTTTASIVEKWLDLTMDPSDSRYAPNIINAGLGSGSFYITVVDQFSSSPLTQSAPSAQVGTSLAATNADGTAAGTTEYLNAINLLDQVQQPLVLNLPGVTDSTNLSNAISYAAARGDIFVVCDTAQGLTASAAVTAVSALSTNPYAAAYFPWVQVNDPSVATPGVTKMLPPGGSVVGQFMSTDATRGVWKAPAGLATDLRGVVALERVLTNSELDSLNTAVPPVNAIRNVLGVGPCIMGARTLDPTTQNIYVPVRRTIIHLKAEIKDLMRSALFEPNDPTLWARLTSDISALLMDFWQQGGLRGTTPQQAFYVKCDATINTNSVVQAGQVIAEVGVAPVTPAEFVVLRIGQSNGGASVTENSI